MNRIIKKFVHIPEISTKRLILRKILKSDYHDMFEYSKREDVTRYLLWSAHESPQQTKEYLDVIQTQYRKGEFYDWAVVLRSENKMIGTCGFTTIDINNNKAEVGYVINPLYWGFGYATEAVCAVLDFAFRELSLERVEARYMAGNERSRRVMEKCGMTYEGKLRRYLYVKGEYKDIGVCSVLSGEFQNRGT